MSQDINAKNGPQSITTMQGAVIGMTCAVAEVTVNHPFWTMKTQKQTEGKIDLRPRIVYRGIWTNMASMIPITAVQVAVSQVIKGRICKDKDPTPGQQVASAFGGGIASSLISGPAEQIMTLQQQMRIGFVATMRKTRISRYFVGLLGTAVRDGVFTATFLAGKRIMTDMIGQRLEQAGLSSETSRRTAVPVGAIGSGVIGASVSQPFDTVKTVQQGKAAPKGPIATAMEIYRANGMRGFFPGFVFRAARVISAVTIMGTVSEWMTEKWKS